MSHNLKLNIKKNSTRMNNLKISHLVLRLKMMLVPRMQDYSRPNIRRQCLQHSLPFFQLSGQYGSEALSCMAKQWLAVEP